MSGLNLFARITKVDEAKRLVYGRAVQEVPDAAGEMFDYETSKPNFQEWSAEIYRDTAGKSLGNVRAMHTNVAAGKLTEIDFNDIDKAIDVCAKIVDDDQWNKVLEGVYTGYSIGGSYVKTWSDSVDGKKVKRYTAKPSELSLVDRPCIPTAKFFEIVKRDGTVVEKDFVSPASATSGVQGYDQEGSKPGKKKKPKKPDVNGDDVDTDPTAEKLMSGDVKKGMYSVSSLANLVCQLQSLAFDSKYEQQAEGDDSTLWKEMLAQVKALGHILAAMAAEEADEAGEEADREAAPTPAMPYYFVRSLAGELAKGLQTAMSNGLTKAGARHSSKDLKLVQQLHDCAKDLGANCGSGDDKSISNPIVSGDRDMSVSKAKSDSKLGDVEGHDGAPSGEESQSANAGKKKASKDMEMAAKAKDSQDDNDEDETPEERKDRLAARAAKKKAEKGLSAQEVGALIEQSNASLLEGVFKGLGLLPNDAASPATNGQVQQVDQSKAPALFAVDRAGGAEKVSSAQELMKNVQPVQGVSGAEGDLATFIKAKHMRGPDEVWDPRRLGNLVGQR